MSGAELGLEGVYPNDGGGEFPPHAGITLRQHFAGLAMRGALGGAPGSHLMPAQLAADSVAYADAMLRELAKEQP